MRPLLDVKPVREIQQNYFNLLRRFFGRPFEEMTKYNLSPGFIASDMAMKPSLVAAFDAERFELIETFADFWRSNRAAVDDYLQNVEAMKSFFGGDISPLVELKHFSSTLLYTDTVVLQCPILRLAPLMPVTAAPQTAMLVIKHALNVMRFEELAVADVEPPILLMTGSAFALDEQYSASFTEASEPYVLAHAQALMGRGFDNSEELKNYLFALRNIPEAVNAIIDPSRALFDTEWKGSLAEQIERSNNDLKTRLGAPEPFSQTGFTLYSAISGRMLQANELILLSSSLGASPLLSAPTSWQYLMWRYEYDAKITHPDMDVKDLLITNAVLTRGDRNEIPLLSGLSVKNIVALRQEGALGSIRELMRNAINRIDSATPYDLKSVSQEVGREMNEAFEKHERELADLANTKKRFYGIDVTSSIAAVALTITGAATGSIPIGVAAVASGFLLGGKSMPELRKSWKELRTKGEEVKRSPAAVLLRNLDK